MVIIPTDFLRALSRGWERAGVDRHAFDKMESCARKALRCNDHGSAGSKRQETHREHMGVSNTVSTIPARCMLCQAVATICRTRPSFFHGDLREKARATSGQGEKGRKNGGVRSCQAPCTVSKEGRDDWGNVGTHNARRPRAAAPGHAHVRPNVQHGAGATNGIFNPIR